MLNILTLAFQAEPWIEKHLPIFEKLTIPWHWVVVHGPANNGGSTAWCQPQPPGLSTDGTDEYLESLLLSSHPNFTLIDRELWGSKDEMVSAALRMFDKPGVLLEIDSDEIWLAEQIEKIVQLFESDPSLGAMAFFCRYFVGPDLVCVGEDCWSNKRYDWIRAWRYEPGIKVVSHEPPKFDRMLGRMMELEEARSHGLVFDHMAYVLEKQVAYKEKFYGYAGAVEGWRRLQAHTQFPVPLRQFFSWLPDDKTLVMRKEGDAICQPNAESAEDTTRQESVLGRSSAAPKFNPESAAVFYSSGDIGDIIASLPAIRALGGGHLLIGNGTDGQRESMAGARFDAIKPLLEAQPYIKSVEWSNDKSPVTHDFSGFRKNRGEDGESLADWQWRHIGLKGNADTSPWLSVPKYVPKWSLSWMRAPVFSRSLRYHNTLFPWSDILKLMGHARCAYFIGLEIEFHAFEKAFGEVHHVHTETLLEVAQIIAECPVFIGNQSAPFWIAAGLGVNIVQETRPYDQNSIVPRSNIIYSRTDYETSKVMEKLE